jgi:hypothetical protein
MRLLEHSKNRLQRRALLLILVAIPFHVESRPQHLDLGPEPLLLGADGGLRRHVAGRAAVLGGGQRDAGRALCVEQRGARLLPGDAARRHVRDHHAAESAAAAGERALQQPRQLRVTEVDVAHVAAPRQRRDAVAQRQQRQVDVRTLLQPLAPILKIISWSIWTL